VILNHSLVPDPDRAGARTLLIDGVQQSCVDINDPRYLKFSYVRRLVSIIDAAGPAGSPLRVLHLGAGAMTLPRYVAASRPGSTQVVIDNDAALVDFVVRELPLPEGADIEVRVDDARAAVETTPDTSFDIVLADVYVGARMPRSVATVEFAEHASRILHSDGVFATNLADLPLLAFSRMQAATLRTVFGDVCAIGEPGMFRGRRFGNVVMAAAHQPGRLPVTRLARIARADLRPARLLRGADLDAFIAGTTALTDAA
jgi:spermidine synthase